MGKKPRPAQAESLLKINREKHPTARISAISRAKLNLLAGIELKPFMH